MSTISGAWKFKDVLTRPTVDFNESVSFEFALHYLFGGVTYNAIGKGKSIYTARAASGATLWALNYAYDINFIDLPGSGDTPSSAEKGVYSNREDQWLNDGEGEYQIIDFGTVPQDVSAEFYEWFRKNARPVFAHIRYNGSDIANVFEGQTATLKCEGMKMDSDVVVEVAESIGGGGASAPDPILAPLSVTENGVYEASQNQLDGFSSVTVDVQPTLQEKTATENGEVLPDAGYDGLSKVTVDLPKYNLFVGVI